MSETRIIVGLGNPGGQYEYTRHNLGFLVVKELSKRFNVTFKPRSFINGLISDIEYNGMQVLLVLPLSYMNNSGSVVKRIIDEYNSELKNILIVCDDMNLDFEQLRLRSQGSDGGHNGLSSIIFHVNAELIPRLRMGIGSPDSGKEGSDYVLEEFTKSEKNNLNDFINEAADCCLMWVREGIEKAMDKFNRRKENGE